MSKEYSIGLYEKAMPDTLSWKEKFLAAKEAGYDFVEISIDASEEKIARVNMSKEERLELVKLMYETGMPLHTMNMSSLTKYSLGNDKPEYVARGMEILEKAIQLLNNYIQNCDNSEDEPYYLLGNAYRKQGNWQQALNNYLEAMERNPESPAVNAHKMVMDILNFYNKDMYNQ